MNNVVLVAVTQRFEDLSHVVTAKESAVFLGAVACTCTLRLVRPQSGTMGKGSVRRRSIPVLHWDKERVLPEILNGAIKVRLVT